MKAEINYSVYPVLFLALVLMLQQAWVPGFFTDGYLYATFAKNAAEKGYWLVPHMSNETYSEFHQHSPFIFILNAIYFKLVGISYSTARIFSAGFSFMSILLLYRWMKEARGKKLAFYVATIFTLIPHLIKQSRFPNMDTPLMFFILLSLYYYFKYYSGGLLKHIILSGLGFGLAMLTKGPVGLMIPLIIAVHILVTKKWHYLTDPKMYIGSLLGIMIFSVWPLTLYTTGNWKIFMQYLDFTFIHTLADARGVEDRNPMAHILFLLKGSALWLGLILWGQYLFFRKRYESELNIFFSIYFFSILLVFSMVGVKYSNYIVPLYPALSVLAAIPLCSLGDTIGYRVGQLVKFLAIVAPLLLLTFPLTVDIKRDKYLHKAMEISHYLPNVPKAWAIVDNVGPYFRVANFLSFHESTECIRLKSSEVIEWLGGNRGQLSDRFADNRWAFLVGEKTFYDINNSSFKKLSGLIRFKNKGLIFAVPTETVMRSPPQSPLFNL